jgi:hypothetical protein
MLKNILLPFLDNSNPGMNKFIFENDLHQKDYMQCSNCNFVEDNLNMMETTNPCPNCNELSVPLGFPAKPDLLLVYAEIVNSFYQYYGLYIENKKMVISWLQGEVDITEEFAEELFLQTSKLNFFKFSDKYKDTLHLDKIAAINFYQGIYRRITIPKIQMSHIVIHSMTLVEMYLSYLIQSILMRSKVRIEIVKHILDSCRNFNDYFKAIKKISSINWKDHIASTLFEGLSTNFEVLKNIRNDLVHRNQFVDNYQVVKDSVTVVSRLLPVIADLHNQFLIGDVEGGWSKGYI